MTGDGLFPFTDEHEMIRQAARDFAQKEIAPIAAEFDESGDFPAATIRKMGEMGFMGIEVPEEYGGSGMDTLAYVLALEEICKADASHGTIMSVNNSLYCFGILKFGTEDAEAEIPARGWPPGSTSARIRSPSRCPARTPAPCAAAPCGMGMLTSSMGASRGSPAGRWRSILWSSP